MMFDSGTRMPAPIFAVLIMIGACSEPLPIEITLVNPCNQVGLDQVDYLQFIPRGTNVDSLGLSSAQPVAAGVSAKVPLPLVSDFSLIVTGHADAHDGPITGLASSTVYDLSAPSESVQITVPFGMLNQFYRTTNLAEPIKCTDMNVARTGASATLMSALGKVLILGGETLRDGHLEYSRAIEMFDPSTGLFEIIGELRTGAQRAFHTATLLADGRVLVTGGESIADNSKDALASALLISINENGYAETEVLRMPEARTGHHAIRLADNRVILIGGRVLVASGPQDETRHSYHAQLAVFDPLKVNSNGSKGDFMTFGVGGIQGEQTLANARFGHSAMLLSSGRDILVAGGYNAQGVVRPFEIVSLIDDQLAVTTASVAGAASAVGPIFHASAVTATGQIIMSGGYDSVAEAAPQGVVPTNAGRNVEIWDYIPARNQLQRLCNDSMQRGRGFHTVSVTSDQAIFVGGRLHDGTPTEQAEVVTLKNVAQNASATCFAAPGRIETMDTPRSQHTVVNLQTGDFLFVGGKKQEAGDQFGTSLPSAEIFVPFREP